MEAFPLQFFFVTEVGYEIVDEYNHRQSCDGCAYVAAAMETPHQIVTGEIPCFECHSRYLFEAYRPYWRAEGAISLNG